MRNTAGLLCVVLWLALPVCGDDIRYVTEEGTQVTTRARLIGSGQGFQALERWDGQIQLVPNGAIQARDMMGDPEPIDIAGMQSLLTELFGAENVRFEGKAPFLVCMVLDGTLDRAGEQRCTQFIKKACTFMKNVDGVFLRYARSMKFPIRDLQFPLVLLIFESDDDFESYAQLATGGRGISAANIAGFYSILTNWLAVRMSTCDTFEVPLHEAIHQQMYNRVLQRLAPIPKWFDEGIATGFEANGQNINVHPVQVNSRYARQSQRLATGVEWRTIVADDQAFTADVLAGDAYTLAWCLHWMLVTQHEDAYQNYVAGLSQLAPLAELGNRERLQQFEDTFGHSVREMQSGFGSAIELGIRRQKVDLRDPMRPGYVEQQQQLGAVQVKAVGNGRGQVGVEGRLKNISPLRSMTYYVTVETQGGQYADWVLADVRPSQTVNLPPKVANQVIPGTRSGPSTAFQVWIRSVAAESPTAGQWKDGRVPGPVTGR